MPASSCSLRKSRRALLCTEHRQGLAENRNTAHHASCVGTDLNRNYDFVFDLNKYFDTASSSVLTYTSPNPCNKYVYQGPNAFSEPETRNIRWLLDTHGRLRWFVDIHGYTSQGEIYHPWGDDQNQNGDAAMNWRNAAFDHQRGRAGDSYQGAYVSRRPGNACLSGQSPARRHPAGA